MYDLVVYWRHRTEHVFGALWSFHAVHHSSEQVDILTTLRLHPLEVVYASLTGAAVLLVGVEAEAAALGYAIYTCWNYFIHTNVKVRFLGVMKYVLVSPFMHQWHHALDRQAAGKNVGVVFAWNDWLFGTAYHPEHWPRDSGSTCRKRCACPKAIGVTWRIHCNMRGQCCASRHRDRVSPSAWVHAPNEAP